ncbi:MAG: site-2 protease family protein [Thermodesulfobacteriota bacterium]
MGRLKRWATGGRPPGGEYGPTRPAVLVPALLFAATVFTTVVAGALYSGADPIAEPASLILGIPFSASLMLILGTHELGHFIASRRHGVITTLPTFIPGPPFPPMIGTFGAVIRIKSPITTKRALVDIGAAGPLSGFVVAVVVTYIGLTLSTVIAVRPTGITLGLGDSLLFKLLTYLAIGPLPEGSEVVLHPVAFAGWIGFFVTAMNLLPLGQLDGGHVVYALIGPRHRLFSRLMVVVLVILGLITWPGWFIWAALIAIIGLYHPPVADQHLPMDSKRRLTSLATLAAFILTFIPRPFYII